MARYNSALISNTITGTASVGSPYNGAFSELTGTAPYTVTLANPTLFPGVNQTFYNATGGTVTLGTPSGNFVGTGGTAATTVPVYAGNVVSVTADGTNYVVISEDGSALTATSATISGTLTVQASGGVTIAPSTTGSIDNVAIGATTRASGAFNTLTANNAVTFTANTASSSTTTGTLVVTGGLGVSGTINAASVSASLTGTIQTASQTNITSVGTLSSLTVSGNILSQAATTASAGSIQVTASDASLRLKWTSSPVADKNTWEVRSVGTGATPYLQFRTINDANTVFTDRVAFTNDGKVGIGTTTPAALLHVGPTSSGAINGYTKFIVDSTDYAVATLKSPAANLSQIIFTDPTATSLGGINYFNSTNATPNAMAFVTAATERMRIDPSGNVGIGLASPQTLLELNQGGGYGQVKHLTLSRSENTRYYAYAGFGDQFGGNTFGWRFGTVNDSTDYPTLYIVNGKVGIGTSTAPAYNLHVRGAQATPTTSFGLRTWNQVPPELYVQSSSAAIGAGGSIGFGARDSGATDYANWRIRSVFSTESGGWGANTALLFDAAPDATGTSNLTNVLSLLGNGNVGIGISSPSTKLHVVVATPSGQAGAPAGTSVLVDSNTNNFVTIRSTADNATNSGILMQDNNVGGYLIFRNYDSSNASISDRMFLSGYQGVNISYGSSDGTDVTSRTTVAKFDSNGLTVASTRFAAGSEYETASVSTGATISSTGYKELFRLGSNRLGCSGFFTIGATRGNYVTTSQYAFSGSHPYQGTITQLSSSNYTQVNVNLDVNSGGEVIISIDWGLGYTGSFPMDYSVTVIKMQGGGAINFGNQGADRSAIPDGYQRRFNFTSQANGFRAENAYFGSLAKASGSFKIDHPLPELEETTNLTHSFIEGPKADLIYRGVVDLVAGQAEVNIDTVSDMTEGTFEALCRTVQCFTSNETDWSAVKGKVTGNILKIECQDTSSTATISWMVVGERKDKHMVGLNWTDANGRVLVESLKNPVQTDFPPYPEHVNTSEDTNGTL